jgi:hypothetical protein
MSSSQVEFGRTEQNSVHWQTSAPAPYPLVRTGESNMGWHPYGNTQPGGVAFSSYGQPVAAHQSEGYAWATSNMALPTRSMSLGGEITADFPSPYGRRDSAMSGSFSPNAGLAASGAQLGTTELEAGGNLPTGASLALGQGSWGQQQPLMSPGLMTSPPGHGNGLEPWPFEQGGPSNPHIGDENGGTTF